jgi:hypothetical protein
LSTGSFLEGLICLRSPDPEDEEQERELDPDQEFGRRLRETKVRLAREAPRRLVALEIADRLEGRERALKERVADECAEVARRGLNHQCVGAERAVLGRHEAELAEIEEVLRAGWSVAHPAIVHGQDDGFPESERCRPCREPLEPGEALRNVGACDGCRKAERQARERNGLELVEWIGG